MALFPKNIVFRNSGNSFRGLRSYFAAYPDKALKTGELFIKYDENEPGYASLLTQDPVHQEMVSVLGTMSQQADVPNPARDYAHKATLTYRDDRIKIVTDPDSLEKKPEPYGSGWDIAAPFPYDITLNSLDDLFDVSTEGQRPQTEGLPRGKREGDTLKWVWLYGPNSIDPITGNPPPESKWFGLWQFGPGLGSKDGNVEASATLQDLVKVTYYNGTAGIEDRSFLRWSQSNQTWLPEVENPTLENREDVDYGEDDEYAPEDGDGLVYDSVSMTWKPGGISDEAVVRIPDGHRGLDRDKEFILLTGKHTNWFGSSNYETGQTIFVQEPTKYNSVGMTWEFSPRTNIYSKDVTPEFYWDRFPDGAIYLEQYIPTTQNFQPQWATFASTKEFDRTFSDAPANTFDVSLYEKGKVGNAFAPAPYLESGIGQEKMTWDGDFTTQFWFRFSAELGTPDIDAPQDPVRPGQTWSFINHGSRIGANWSQLYWYVRYSPKLSDLYGGRIRQQLRLQVHPADDDSYADPTAETVIDDLRADTDYHVCFVWDATAARYKIWVNGVVAVQRDTPFIGTPFGFDLRNLTIGAKPEDPVGAIRGWIADYVVTLIKEHPTEPIPVLTGEVDFAPPGPWARRIVEGPKAALKTLGITDSGFFNWIAKDQPFKWNTAFSSGQRYWSEEQLSMDERQFRGGEILAWNGSTFGTVKDKGGNDFRLKQNPGKPPAKWIFSSIYNAANVPAFMDPLSGSLAPAVNYTDPYGNLWKGVNWGARYGESLTGRSTGRAPFPTFIGAPAASPDFSGLPGVYASLVDHQPFVFSQDLETWKRGPGWITEGSEFQTDGRLEIFEDPDINGGEGFHAFSIQFRAYQYQDLGEIVSDNFYEITAERQDGAITFRLYNAQSYNNPPANSIDYSLYAPYAFTDGFTNRIEFRTRVNCLKENAENEITVIHDFKREKLFIYVNGKRELFYQVLSNDFFAMVGGEEPGVTEDEEVLAQYMPDPKPRDTLYYTQAVLNKGLPEYIAIGHQANPTPNARVERYCPFIGGNYMVSSACVLRSFAIRFDRDEDWDEQQAYDFSGWYDTVARHPGRSDFNGAKIARAETAGFIQSSDEKTSAGTRATQLNGQYVGASRSLYQLGFKPYGDEWLTQTLNAFVGIRDVDNDSTECRFVDSSSLGLPGQDFYYASGPQFNENLYYFKDVGTYGIAWKDDEVLTFRNGLFWAEPVDDSSPIFLTANEPCTEPFDGQFLAWNERLHGYQNVDVDTMNVSLDDLTDVTITSDPSSNDQLFYDIMSKEWLNHGTYYIESIRGLNDVRIGQGYPPDQSLLTWDYVLKVFTPDDYVQITRLSDLEDVNVESLEFQSGRPPDDSCFFTFDAGLRQWVSERNGTRGGSGNVNWVGEWSTSVQPDGAFRRRVGRAMGLGSIQGRTIRPTTLIDTGKPVLFTENYNDSHNTGRGDGGDFVYGDMDFGMPFGVYGGGNFETAAVDVPVEFIAGADGGDWAIGPSGASIPWDNRRGMDAFVVGGHDYDYNELILPVEGQGALVDLSYRVGIQPDQEAVIDGEAYRSGGAVYFPQYRWTEAWNYRPSPEYIPETSLNYGPEGRFAWQVAEKLDIQDVDWSIEFDVNLVNPNTGYFYLLTYGGDQGGNSSRHFTIFVRHYNHGTMKYYEFIKYSFYLPEWEVYIPWDDQIQLDYHPPDGPAASYFSYDGWNYNSPERTFNWTFNSWAHCVVCYTASTRRFSIYYNGECFASWNIQYDRSTSRQAEAGFDPDVPGSLIPFYGFAVTPWERRRMYYTDMIGFGCQPNRGRYENSGNLQGGIKQIRVMKGNTPYDANGNSVPSPQIPYPKNPVPPANNPQLPYESMRAELVSSLSFEGELSPVDSVGRRWLPNPFTVEAQDSFNIRPYPSRQGQTPGYQVNYLLADEGVYFHNRLNPLEGEWNGRCGYKTPLVPALDLSDKTFTMDTMISVDFKHWDALDVQMDTILTKELVEHSVILLNAAGEDDLSDPSSGRSWAVRILDFHPQDERYYGKSWDNGVRFEWWIEDDKGRAKYHNLDFWFGPDCWRSVMADRYNTYNNRVTGPLDPGQPNPPGQDFCHLIVQRDMKAGSIRVIVNGASQIQFHPTLKQRFFDVTRFNNPLMAIGMDANMNFDEGYDFSGYMNYFRLITGDLLYGNVCEFPLTAPPLLAW